jgi:hypothetical protein
MKQRHILTTGDTITLTAIDEPAHLRRVDDHTIGALLTSTSQTFGPYTHETHWEQDGGTVTIARDIQEAAEIGSGSADVKLLTGEGAPVDFEAAVAATLTIDSIAANSDLTFTAVTAGVAGNSYTVAIVQPTEVDQSLAIAFDGTDAVISLPTDGSGDPVAATATDVETAWALEAVAAVITCEAEGTGAGTVEIAAEAPLADGADQIDGTGYGVAGTGSMYTDYDTPGLYFNTGTKAAPVWFEIATS